MAWNTHYQCCFQSLNGTQYAVNIKEQDYTGSIVVLTGADEPFVTQEDTNNDIYTPLRVQTGYLRVIDTDGTLLEQMMPTNNTERLVELVSGTYVGTWPDGRFVQGGLLTSTHWQGFLQSQAYTQPWDNQARMLEFPVKSLLGALDDVQIGTSDASKETPVAGLLSGAFRALFGGVSIPLNYVFSIDDGVETENWLTPIVQWSAFFTEEQMNNQADTYTTLVGYSYAEALSGVLALFGLQARENGRDLYFAHYDQTNGMSCRVNRYTWNTISSMGAGGSVQVTPIGQLASSDLVNSLTFEGDDNVAGFLPGGRTVRLDLSIDSGVRMHLNLPPTTEDDSTVYQIQNLAESQGEVYVQPHAPRGGQNETFTFTEMRQDGAYNATRVGASTYQKCLQNSVIFRPLYNPHWNSTDNLHTGAFPCRWMQKKNATDSPTLKNGLFLNQEWLTLEWRSFQAYACYSIYTALAYRQKNGYLNINMCCYNFMQGVLAGDSNKLFFGDVPFDVGGKPQTQLSFILTWGDKQWDGEQWIARPTSGNLQIFHINFEGVTVATNKTEDMTVDGTAGWFIPVQDEMNGVLRLYIMNCGSVYYEGGYNNSHSRIITDLSVEWKGNAEAVVSQRTHNTYWRQISSMGFSGDKSTSLTVGTFNNNVPSVVFLKSDETTYIEQMTYYTTSGTISQRPELRLLDRMQRYYSSVRRTFEAVVHRGVDTLGRVYTHQSRRFYAVRAKTEWREDRELLKFIEI